MVLGGPLFFLSLFGKFCVCLEKEEDRKARQALHELTVLGHRVSWFTKANESSVTKLSSDVTRGAKKLLGGLFGSGKGAAITPSTDPSIVHARLIFRDNDEHTPEILVDPLPRPSGQSVGYKLNIALYRVHNIQADNDSGEIRLYAKAPPPTNAGSKQAPQAKLLLMIGLLKDSNTPATEQERTSFVHNLSALAEWERQRRAAAGIEDDEEEQGGNFLTQRAHKAAHFAKRELEMQQTKRDREKRKAKLVAESGGLKYTALALSNRED